MNFNYKSLFKEGSLFAEEDGDGSMGTVYMVLVFAIATLLLVLVVKPVFQQSQKVIPKVGSSGS